MQPFPKTIVWRHQKENLKKCSLRGLEARNDLLFYKYPQQTPQGLEGYLTLAVDAPELTPEDADRGLFLIDGTWRYAEKMAAALPKDLPLEKRSIPSRYRTAYPRRQEDCAEPDRGLASVEALYLAYLLLGRDTDGLLDHYYWKNRFLQMNNLAVK